MVGHALDAEIDGALGEQHVLPEVAEAARRPRALREAEEAGPVAAQRGVREDSVFDAGDAGDAQRAPVREGALAAGRPPPLPERRRRHDRDASFERDQRGEERDPADVVLRRVDRVDHPVALLAALLLAEHRLARPLAPDPLAQRLLDRAVGLGHGGQVGLGLDVQVGGPEARERDRVGDVGELQGEREIRLHRQPRAYLYERRRKLAAIFAKPACCDAADEDSV